MTKQSASTGFSTVEVLVPPKIKEVALSSFTLSCIGGDKKQTSKRAVAHPHSWSSRKLLRFASSVVARCRSDVLAGGDG